jgi:hypothetical protein
MEFPKTLTNSGDPKVQRIQQICPKTVGKNEKIWLCNTCCIYMKKGKIPPISKMNKMSFPKTCILQTLNPLEQTLLAIRLPFMKIHQVPRGRQKTSWQYGTCTCSC